MADKKQIEKPTAEQVHVPMKDVVNIIRWLTYALCFGLLLLPFHLNIWQNLCGALILGWFASLLNGIKNEGK